MQTTPTKRHRSVGLTPTETRVLRLIARGLTAQEAAEKMGISKRTVDFHLGNIFSFLSVSNRIQAINAARERGWI